MGDANNRLTGLIRAAEAGEEVTITRHGQPVAQLTTPPEVERPKVIFGGMKDIIKFYPGWDDPITEDQFFAGDF